MNLFKLLSMPIGLIMLATALLMEKFLPSTGCTDFTVGFLMGLSVVLNIYYIIAVVSHKFKK